MRTASTFATLAFIASTSLAQTTTISESAYLEKLRGMWLAQCIANWTGLRTEGQRNNPPFLTDADWGTYLNWGNIDFVTWQNPWGADDDTDIEYVYLHLAHNLATPSLAPEHIAAGWQTHINRFIWVSNANARALMQRGCVPPSTSLAIANPGRLAIDVQLTTEFFGCFAPGSPVLALQLADNPITTTASGYAVHAAQFFVVLYALAPVVPTELSPRERGIWLVEQALQFIPATSKTAGIAQFVLADYLANPDVNDWERTRDLVHVQYQSQAAANGFIYRGFFESSVNFATGLIALLYGEGDLKRTIQIGTLSGWDSDNGTATMGGLIGLMQGEAAVRQAFAPAWLSTNYWAGRTRDNLPDYAPNDPAWDDTFSQMALRMLPLARAGVIASGGSVAIENDEPRWTLPPLPPPALRASANPRIADDARSATRRVRAAGGTASASCSVVSTAARGSPDLTVVTNRLETSTSGVEEDGWWVRFFSSERTVQSASEQSVSVTYSLPVTAQTVRFIEGEHYQTSPTGGWFESPVTIELLVQGSWVAVTSRGTKTLSASVPFEVVDFVLPVPVVCQGARVGGTPGGEARFFTCAELDVLELGHAGFDASSDLRISSEDIYAWFAQPQDTLRDGTANDVDARAVASLVRASERAKLLSRAHNP